MPSRQLVPRCRPPPSSARRGEVGVRTPASAACVAGGRRSSEASTSMCKGLAAFLDFFLGGGGTSARHFRAVIARRLSIIFVERSCRCTPLYFGARPALLCNLHSAPCWVEEAPGSGAAGEASRHLRTRVVNFGPRGPAFVRVLHATAAGHCGCRQHFTAKLFDPQGTEHTSFLHEDFKTIFYFPRPSFLSERREWLPKKIRTRALSKKFEWWNE